MITCNYNNIKNILEVTYSGQISMSDINKHGEKIMNNKNLPRNLLILTNASVACYDYKNINYFSMMKNMKKHLEPYIFVKNAILHSKPVETAISMVIENKIKISNYKQKIFYTEKAALKWLKNEKF